MKFNKDSIITKKRIFTIGNPPFGKNASLALKFLNKSSEFSDYIAFILPKTFKKTSMKNKIDPSMHLVFEEDLVKNSFIHKDQDYNVPCVFQIWEKRKEKRLKIEEKKQSVFFDFCSKDEADFAIRRVGGLSGKVILDFDKYKEPSHYYIKVRKNHDKDNLIKTLIHCYKEFQDAASNTAGNPSLSKGELVMIIEKNINDI